MKSQRPTSKRLRLQTRAKDVAEQDRYRKLMTARRRRTTRDFCLDMKEANMWKCSLHKHFKTDFPNKLAGKFLVFGMIVLPPSNSLPCTLQTTSSQGIIVGNSIIQFRLDFLWGRIKSISGMILFLWYSETSQWHIYCVDINKNLLSFINFHCETFNWFPLPEYRLMDC